MSPGKKIFHFSLAVHVLLLPKAPGESEQRGSFSVCPQIRDARACEIANYYLAQRLVPPTRSEAVISGPSTELASFILLALQHKHAHFFFFCLMNTNNKKNTDVNWHFIDHSIMHLTRASNIQHHQECRFNQKKKFSAQWSWMQRSQMWVSLHYRQESQQPNDKPHKMGSK